MRRNKKTYSKINYDDFHETTSAQSKIIVENNFTYKTILSVINKWIKKNDKILDIGCGAGTLCLYYANKGNDVLGIDISGKGIDSANQSAHYLGLNNVKFKKMNFPTQVPQEKFDFIIFSEVIEHLKNDDLVLKKIFLLLKPKGMVFISTPSRNAPLHRLGLAKKFDKNVGHLRRYEMEDLINKCENVGFKIIETKRTEGIIRNFLYLNPVAGKIIRFIRYFLVDLVLAIDWISMKFFGESDLILIAQKPGK
jgi:cyclopropane fatty-acyl-phospholipid synthase-like methyltransferase